ncbi:class I SAM-dependent methyltransferase [Planococcus sp. ISL-109]|uniref:class I SAM-dependent methyltransferase n=1 Tax=Planococcus sp. ISL-109 TaxID=2819166 RepID=UPI001BEBBB47|nr:class I SAM-dependent methyltransferase [Planococcus sp. ISL-109]MBT2583063.1 class I SAM-dependent methyltransferase [Planococcus sp. ISL-109]
MGREFVGIFDEWVHTYDESVSGKDPEYEAVFKNYQEILLAVAKKATGPVVEFGVGTGNLTAALLQEGLAVTGIEPNNSMRNVAGQKFPELHIMDGDFLAFELPVKPHSFVSSYAFHHLTDEEKAQAIQQYASILPPSGKVVFADTVFESDEAKLGRIVFEEAEGHANLVEDLKREHYTTVPVFEMIFQEHGFDVTFTRLNEYVFLIDATKR